jgi:uncharacterized protein (DUF433 family)
MPITLHAETPPIRESGGALRVGGTGLTLETVLWAFQQGATPEDITDQFPSLTLAEVYDVIAYYLRHRGDVDQYLAQQEEQYHEAAETLRSEFPATNLQARLRGRLNR